MRRPQSEIKYLIAHVGDVVWFTRLIHLVHELLDELDARLGPRTTFLAQSLLDDVAQMLFILEFLLIDHRLLSFQWKAA